MRHILTWASLGHSDATTNINASGNLFYNLKGGAIQWNHQNPAGVVNISNNVWSKSVNDTYKPVNSDEAFFACKIVMLSRFAALSVSLTRKVPPFQGTATAPTRLSRAAMPRRARST